MQITLLLLTLLALLIEVGCGVLPEGRTAKNEVRALNGVKLINPNLTSGYESSSFGQTQYDLDTTSRLLLRFEDLQNHVKNIRIDQQNRVQLQITLINGTSAATVGQYVRACPVLKNWMMLATWDRAHPYSGLGKWDQSGGDFDPNECISATPSGAQTLVFDITSWFLDHVKARNINYGLIMISDIPLSIYGEKSGNLFPRILWNEGYVFNYFQVP